MSATVTEWRESDGAYERRYVASGELAARVAYAAGRTIGGVSRPWFMTVYRDGSDGLFAWWSYATLGEAIAGADDELSAIVPGLRSKS